MIAQGNNQRTSSYVFLGLNLFQINGHVLLTFIHCLLRYYSRAFLSSYHLTITDAIFQQV